MSTQRQLVAEIAETRSAELRAAYPDLVGVGHGFRRRGSTGRHNQTRIAGELTNEPCVLFMVKRKWRHTPRSDRVRSRHLPRTLWAYSVAFDAETRQLERKLCAVPTDVVSAAGYKLRPGAGDKAGSVRMTCDNVIPQRGTFACGVREGDGGPLFGLTCHHVAAMSTAGNQLGQPAIGAEAHLRSSSASLVGALAAEPIGSLVPDNQQLSFDVALVSVDEADPSAFDSLLEACCGARPTLFHDDPSAIPLLCQVMTSHGIIDAEYVGEHFMFDRIDYFPGYAPPVQARILEFATVGDYTQAGDSGCAIVAFEGAVLVGLHLGGDDKSNAIFALPGYLLPIPANWTGLSEPLVLAALG